MKRLTLDQTWNECLAMWKWISRQQFDSRRTSIHLKDEWLAKNGYEEGSILRACFFCDKCKEDCSNCPGTKVDPDFHCVNSYYNYHRGRLFYAELKRLNKIRLAKK